MKRIFEWLGGFALIAFSFYFTDKVSLMVASKSDLMQEIVSVSDEYKEDYIDAVIDVKDNTIVPGKYGKEINNEESYLNMHDFGSFNENYLVYDYIKPKTSLEENKDKYIVSGNPKNRSVGVIIEPSENIQKYLESKDVEYDIIATSAQDITDSEAEYINGASNLEYFKTLDSKISNNKHICIKEYSNLELCIKSNYYIILPQVTLNNSNIVEVKNNIGPGSIILISSKTDIKNIEFILNEINYKDLDIVYISKLIDEKGAA